MQGAVDVGQLGCELIGLRVVNEVLTFEGSLVVEGHATNLDERAHP